MNRKIKKLAWTNDMLRVIAQNYKTKSTSDIAALINAQFGTNKSADAIQHKGNNHGFRMKGSI